MGRQEGKMARVDRERERKRGREGVMKSTSGCTDFGKINSYTSLQTRHSNPFTIQKKEHFSKVSATVSVGLMMAYLLTSMATARSALASFNLAFFGATTRATLTRKEEREGECAV